MSQGSSLLHRSAGTLNAGDVVPPDAARVTLVLDHPSFTEGQPITGRVVRAAGPLAVEIACVVSIEGLAVGEIAQNPPLAPVQIAPGAASAAFSFATNALSGTQAKTGTARITSSSNAQIGVPSSVNFSYLDDVVAPTLPVVQFTGLPAAGTIPEINEDPAGATYYRVQITRTIVAPDVGLTVWWEKQGFEPTDITRYAKSGSTTFAVGETSKAFDVEAKDVAADRIITSVLLPNEAYALTVNQSFQVKIKNTGSTAPPGSEEWWKDGWKRNAQNQIVSPHMGLPYLHGNNFYSKSDTDNYFIPFYGATDAVNGSACWDWKPQDWNLFRGGSSTDPAVIDANSWLNFNKSGHVSYWWDATFAATYPDSWLVLNLVTIPNMQVSTNLSPLVTAAQQEALVEDIIAGRKDADLILIGRRMRRMVETLGSGNRRGKAKRVMCRPNWEFQGNTSLCVGSKSYGFLDWYVTGRASPISQTAARDKYRAMMSQWIKKVREGYAMDYNDHANYSVANGGPPRLRFGISLAMFNKRGFPLEDFILDADDYDVVDMMFHPSKDNSQSAQQLWDLFWKPTPDTGWSSGKHTQHDALRCAEHWNLPMCSWENAPTRTSSGYTPVKTYVCPADYAATTYLRYAYVYTSTGIYQCMSPGSGASTVRPTHTSGEVTGADGYKWRFCFNLSRKLSPLEFSELLWHDRAMIYGATVMLGSFHSSAANDGYTGSDSGWATAEKDFTSPTSNASDWRRWQQMRKRFAGKRA